MHPIIYDVAVSIDGYISGPDGDISQFAHEGAVVDDYMARLSEYAVAVMGRATYEFGYRFGLQPGQNPYRHMKTLVFSTSLSLPDDSEVATRAVADAAALKRLKAEAAGPIYLCGGGSFAGALFSMGMIDLVRLKRAPVVLGGGVRLFGEAARSVRLRHRETRPYAGGYVFQEFEVTPPDAAAHASRFEKTS